MLQNGVLLGQQLDLPPRPGGGVAPGVQHQVGHGEDVGVAARVLAGHGPDAGQQLVKVEGLHQVVVAPQIQAAHPVGHAVAGGEEEHRGVRPLGPQLLHQGIPVLLGQHHVQQDAVVLRPHQVELRLLPVHAAVHRVPGAGQHLAQQQVQIRLVLHHQNTHTAPPFPLMGFICPHHSTARPILPVPAGRFPSAAGAHPLGVLCSFSISRNIPYILHRPRKNNVRCFVTFKLDLFPSAGVSWSPEQPRAERREYPEKEMFL